MTSFEEVGQLRCRAQSVDCWSETTRGRISPAPLRPGAHARLLCSFCAISIPWPIGDQTREAPCFTTVCARGDQLDLPDLAAEGSASVRSFLPQPRRNRCRRACVPQSGISRGQGWRVSPWRAAVAPGAVSGRPVARASHVTTTEPGSLEALRWIAQTMVGRVGERDIPSGRFREVAHASTTRRTLLDRTRYVLKGARCPSEKRSQSAARDDADEEYESMILRRTPTAGSAYQHEQPPR